MSNNNGTPVFTAIGSALAGYMSWMKWHSIGWVVLHALFGWVYVIYYLLTYGTPPHW